MLLHEGLTHIHSQKKPWLHFGESLTLSVIVSEMVIKSRTAAALVQWEPAQYPNSASQSAILSPLTLNLCPAHPPRCSVLRAPGPAPQDVAAWGLILSAGPAGAQTQCAVNSNRPQRGQTFSRVVWRLRLTHSISTLLALNFTIWVQTKHYLASVPPVWTRRMRRKMH